LVMAGDVCYDYHLWVDQYFSSGLGIHGDQ
jgi:hypothetical protein